MCACERALCMCARYDVRMLLAVRTCALHVHRYGKASDPMTNTMHGNACVKFSIANGRCSCPRQDSIPLPRPSFSAPLQICKPRHNVRFALRPALPVPLHFLFLLRFYPCENRMQPDSCLAASFDLNGEQARNLPHERATPNSAQFEAMRRMASPATRREMRKSNLTRSSRIDPVFLQGLPHGNLPRLRKAKCGPCQYSNLSHLGITNPSCKPFQKEATTVINADRLPRELGWLAPAPPRPSFPPPRPPDQRLTQTPNRPQPLPPPPFPPPARCAQRPGRARCSLPPPAPHPRRAAHPLPDGRLRQPRQTEEQGAPTAKQNLKAGPQSTIPSGPIRQGSAPKQITCKRQANNNCKNTALREGWTETQACLHPGCCCCRKRRHFRDQSTAALILTIPRPARSKQVQLTGTWLPQEHLPWL